MKRLAIPNIGYYGVIFKGLEDKLGFELVDTPRVSSESMELAARCSPEAICVPFRLILGSFLEAREQGAEGGIFFGGCGPCRFNYYSRLYQLLLGDEGFEIYDFRPQNALRLLGKISSTPLRTVVRGLASALRRAWLVEKAEELSWYYRPRERYPGETTAALDECIKLVGQGKGHYRLFKKKFKKIGIRGAESKLSAHGLRTKDHGPLKIGVIGELYALIDPHLNCDVDILLGEAGAQVHKSVRLLNELEHLTRLDVFTGRSEGRTAKVAEPYLKTTLGGHGRVSVADMLRYQRMGFDGVVHLLPMACLPEISARPILKKIQKDFSFPLLTLSFDEMTSKNAVQTRIEAFVEMLKMKKGGAGEGLAGDRLW
jgi:predicted nucleotide-binding protein (sugar kinase/HSP70/actin superfamily)